MVLGVVIVVEYDDSDSVVILFGIHYYSVDCFHGGVLVNAMG